MKTTHTDITNVDSFTINQGSNTSTQINLKIAQLSADGGGIVYLTSDSFGGNSTIPLDGAMYGADNVTVYIDAGVTLQLTAEVNKAYDVSYTTNAGLAGGGTFDVAGNASYAVYGVASKDTYVGGGRLPGENFSENNTQLSIEGWKNGILIESSNAEAAINPTLYDLVLQNPNDSGVNYPVRIGNRSSQNGKFVEGVDFDGLNVDGGHFVYNSDGTPVLDNNGEQVREGGAWSSSADNIYTADQITLQSVTGGTVKNTSSLNGGEVGITVSRGSSDIEFLNTHVAGADGHGFNIGGGSYALDINQISDIHSAMQSLETGLIRDVFDSTIKPQTESIGLRSSVNFLIEGDSSGATAIFNTLFWDTPGTDNGSGRIWINQAGGARFEDGENIIITGYYKYHENGEQEFIEFSTLISVNILDTHRTEDITIRDSVSEDNGPVGLTGIPFADYYMQQAENIEIINSVSQDSAYGLFVSTSSYKIDNVIFNNVVNEIKQVGDATRIFEGTSGDDQIHGATFANYIDGGDGNDTLNGGNANDIIHGGDDNDFIRGLNGHDFIEGGAGNDIAFGANGNDFISGGSGDDKLYGNAGQDIIEGGDGNDIISGGADNDIIFGQEGDDKLYGQSGDDIISGGSGDDLINGGNGNDTVSYENSLNGIVINIESTSQNTIGAGVDTISNIENITGSNYNDTLRGDDIANILTGNGGKDIIYGRDGDDVIHGGDDDDRLYGNNGDDIIKGGKGSDLIQGGSGNDVLFGDGENDNLNGQAGNDTINGGDGADFIQGGSGDDTILGGLGNDILNGQSGNDVIHTGEGYDTIYGGTGADQFILDNIGLGVSTIKDFNSSEGDLIDISSLLETYNPLQDNINDFVFVTNNGTNTFILIDNNGSGNVDNASQVATLENVNNLDLDIAVNNGEILI